MAIFALEKSCWVEIGYPNTAFMTDKLKTK